MLEVSEFYKRFGEELSLQLVAGKEGITRSIKTPEIERPGLSLTGFLRGHSHKRVLVFGRVEIEYLRNLQEPLRRKRLSAIFTEQLPLVIITRKLKPFKEMMELAEERKIPLFRTNLITSDVLQKITMVLGEEFSPQMSCHGTLVETYGIGVLIQGDSSVGKSETALGLIERGHRLISDDVVIIKKKQGSNLVGTGPELTRHMLEIRGIGIINVAHLYGAVCISEKTRIDVVVKLEEWDPDHFYDRVGLEERYLELLSVKVPYYILPVKPGRDVVLLLETIVLNHRLKRMGYNSAKEFNVKLLETIAKKQEKLGEPFLIPNE